MWNYAMHDHLIAIIIVIIIIIMKFSILQWCSQVSDNQDKHSRLQDQDQDQDLSLRPGQ